MPKSHCGVCLSKEHFTAECPRYHRPEPPVVPAPVQNVTESVPVTKKRGRPKKADALTPAQRKQRQRAKGG